jgi:hypothetical protein
MFRIQEVPQRLFRLRSFGGGALVATLLLAGCGGDAESAGDPGSSPISEFQEEEFAETEAEAPVEPAAPSAAAPSAAAPAAQPQPARRPTPGAPAPATDAPAAAAPEEAPPAAPAPRAIAAGTRLGILTETELSTRTHTAGAVFQGRVESAVVDAAGNVLVPAGTRVEGRVLESRGTTDAMEEAVLYLGVETLILEGRRLPLRATVESAELELQAADSGARSAAKVATGAAAGAVVGRLLGRDTRSTVTGAVVGAAAGAGVAVTTQGGHATLRPGSVLVLRLDEAVVLGDRP